MKIFYDKEVDAAYIKFSGEKPFGVIEITEDINMDVTSSGEIVGIEILDVSKKFPIENLFKLEFDTESLLKR